MAKLKTSVSTFHQLGTLILATEQTLFALRRALNELTALDKHVGHAAVTF